MVLSSDQGTVVSVDGGKSWSTWYNQPTAEIYHVAADNRSPTGCTARSRTAGRCGVSTWSKEGTLDFRNWEPICLAGESDTVVPDPKERQYSVRRRRGALQPGAEYPGFAGRRAAGGRSQRS